MCITRGLANKRSSESLIKLSYEAVTNKGSSGASVKVRANEEGESSVHEEALTQPDSVKVPIVAENTVSSSCDLNNRDNPKGRNSRYFVKHKEYVDRSEDIPEIPSDQKKPRGGASIPFPLKLHQMLDDVENSGLTYIVSWKSHGRAFMVHKRDEFVDQILPAYFHQHKFASFQRQLNLYGFSRISTGKDKGVYYHELFLRGRQLLTSKMVRTKVKGNATRGSSNPYAEPDFYNMKPLGPLKRETLNKIYDLSNNLINEHMAQVIDEEIIKMFSCWNDYKTIELDTISSGVSA